MANPIICPLCKGRLLDLPRTCPGCGGDLGGLVKLRDFANRRFNTGLRMAKAERWEEAEEAMVAALAIDPGDAEAGRVLAKIRQKSAGRRRRRPSQPD
ncbi:hypothetical protein CLV63_105166 [Murinocardiopsis flavida]|uniref:Tetratricopeptide repeat protein n=1 Tax=Murinocardiopsis flavida TaxID=645275 RepID=A0A2P8DMQ3_9ACTN|nr:hypothetical protein [Murinocardiopsis flavida]PSK98492.1 hypothetical protein CLV63_105166 [Murinocardiopsis flavida]